MVDVLPSSVVTARCSAAGLGRLGRVGRDNRLPTCPHALALLSWKAEGRLEGPCLLALLVDKALQQLDISPARLLGVKAGMGGGAGLGLGEEAVARLWDQQMEGDVGPVKLWFEASDRKSGRPLVYGAYILLTTSPDNHAPTTIIV